MEVQILDKMRELDTVDVQGIYYIPEGGPGTVPPEGVAFLLSGGQAAIFTSAADWTLQVQSGTWNALPSWRFPPEDWDFLPISGATPEEELGRAGEIEERANSVGEVVGVTIVYEAMPSKLLRVSRSALFACHFDPQPLFLGELGGCD